MTHARRAAVCSAAALAMLAGCATAPSKFYALSSTATGDGAPPAP